MCFLQRDMFIAIGIRKFIHVREAVCVFFRESYIFFMIIDIRNSHVCVKRYASSPERDLVYMIIDIRNSHLCLKRHVSSSERDIFMLLDATGFVLTREAVCVFFRERSVYDHRHQKIRTYA